MSIKTLVYEINTDDSTREKNVTHIALSSAHLKYL